MKTQPNYISEPIPTKRLINSLVKKYNKDTNKGGLGPSIKLEDESFVSDIIYASICRDDLVNLDVNPRYSTIDNYCFIAAGFEFYAEGGEQGIKKQFNMSSYLLISAFVLSHINGLKENKKKFQDKMRELAYCN